jgi:hypothetical protein
MEQKCKLPDNFNLKEYLRAFRQLSPINGVNENMSDSETSYTANLAFANHFKSLEAKDAAKHDGLNWFIHESAKAQIVKMNVLPIVVYSGANVYFVDKIL